MKFFIGITPPTDINEQIFNFQKSFPSNKVPYFNEPHITLKAPSALTEDKVWLPALIHFVGNYEPFEIKLEGLDGFEDRVLFLNPVFSENLIDLHNAIVTLLNPSTEDQERFFEGSLWHPHLTLGESTWGGMTAEEIKIMREKAETKFLNIPPFLVTFLRLYKKDGDGKPYYKFLDIPLKI